MPILIKHRCGEVLSTIADFPPMEDLLEHVHKKHNGRCPKCGGKLSWKPLKVDVRPLGREVAHDMRVRKFLAER